MTGEGGEGWARLARFGPFFAVNRVGPGAEWRPVADLGRPEVLRRRAAAVSAALGAGLPDDRVVPERVAASVSQLGLCARLGAVMLGSAVDRLPVPASEHWRYVDRLGGPYPLGLRADPTDRPATIWPTPFLDLVRPIAATTITTFALSPQVVWGNVASGLYGAVRMIMAADPAAAAAAEALLAEALASDELRATMTDDGLGGRRRRSCCLIYRLSESTAAVCGDCVLQPA